MILFYWLFGCAYISDKDHQNRIDNDGDGVLWPTDCDDNNANVGIREWYIDEDADGFGLTESLVTACNPPNEAMAEQGGDCNDQDASVHPEQVESCDTIDNDCDELIDFDDPDLDETMQATFFRDADEDGFGDPNDSQQACEPPPGYVAESDDCDDSNADINPAAQEVCDGYDNNCDGLLDNEDPDIDPDDIQTYYLDNDGDGFGWSADSIESCFPPENYVNNSDDCDDLNDLIHPNAAEVCDGIDNDCDNDIDTEDTNLISGEAQTYYLDSDGDGYGSATNSLLSCSQPANYVSNSNDCDDSDSSLLAQSNDMDCDGIITADDCDDNDPATINDMDCDGVTTTDDCDDYNPQIYPFATENAFDGVDQNCDDMELFTDACEGILQSGKYYLLCDENLSYSDAQDECALSGYSLGSITSSWEQTKVDQLINSSTFGFSILWIGLYSQTGFGTSNFDWEDGSSFSYSNWALSQPSSGSITSRCVSYYTGSGQGYAGWVVQTCSQEQGFLCTTTP